MSRLHFNYFGIKKNSRDDITIHVDITDFKESIAKYFGIDPDDDNAMTIKLKPVITNGESFLSFCEDINYSPVIAIELLINGKFDVLAEPRVIPKLKQIVQHYGISPDGSIYR